MKWKLCARVGADAMQSDGKVESDCGVKVCVCVWARETAKMVSVRVLADRNFFRERASHTLCGENPSCLVSFICLPVENRVETVNACLVATKKNLFPESRLNFQACAFCMCPDTQTGCAEGALIFFF